MIDLVASSAPVGCKGQVHMNWDLMYELMHQDAKLEAITDCSDTLGFRGAGRCCIMPTARPSGFSATRYRRC